MHDRPARGRQDAADQWREIGRVLRLLVALLLTTTLIVLLLRGVGVL